LTPIESTRLGFRNSRAVNMPVPGPGTYAVTRQKGFFGKLERAEDVGRSPGDTGTRVKPLVPTRSQAINWDALDRALPTGKDRASKLKRDELFERFDGNNNGILSLAEADGGIRRALHDVGAGWVPAPVISRAFHAARDIAPPVADFSDDYIDRHEFRYLYIYLKHYLKLWQIFERMDTKGDHRIDRGEFEKGLDALHEVAFQKETLEDLKRSKDEIFEDMDYNSGGLILFDEFADFCLRKSLLGLEGVDEAEQKQAMEVLVKKQPNLCGQGFNKPHQASPRPK
jgi:hypothetical protein